MTSDEKNPLNPSSGFSFEDEIIEDSPDRSGGEPESGPSLETTESGSDPVPVFDEEEPEDESYAEYTSLSAGVQDLDDNFDDEDFAETGDDDDDDDFDFAFDEEPKGKDFKKYLLPGVIILVALGAGGFILMNPSIIGLGGKGNAPASVTASSQMPAPNTQIAENEMPEILEEPEIAQAPPQPAVNMNEMPRPPETGEIDEIFTFSESEGLTDLTASADSEDPFAALDQDLTETPATPETAGEEQAIPAGEEQTLPAGEENQVTESDTALFAEPVTEDAAIEDTTIEDAAIDVVESEFNPPANDNDLLALKDDDNSLPNTTSEIVEIPASQEPEMPALPDTPEIGGTGTADTAANGGVRTDNQSADTGTGQSPETSSIQVAQPEAASSEVPGLPQQQQAEDLYYDSRLNVPTGPLSSPAGPGKLDPVQEPASKYVIVQKTYSASDQESVIVAASRALKLGRYDAAAELYDSLYANNKRDERILMGRAVAYQNLGRHEVAIQTYEKLLELSPNNADAMVNMLGLLRKQYPEVALRRLLNLQEKFPNKVSIVAQIGITQADLGHTDDALRYLGMAASLEPKNAQHMFNMAVISDRVGRTKEAIQFYEGALETDSVYGGGRSVPREQIYDRLAVLRRR